jgi:hypothetical protein
MIMHRFHISAFKKFCIVFLLVALLATPSLARRMENPEDPGDPGGGGGGGADVLECTSASWCMTCTLCCSTVSVEQITADAFDKYRKNFIMSSFYTDSFEEGLQKSTDDIRNAELLKTATFGAFLDASSFADAALVLQKMSAQILQSYTPSEQMCRFGTISRSLAASDARVDSNRLALSEIGLSRNLGKVRSVASSGLGLDFESRMKLFVDQFCDLTDNNSGLTQMCQVATPVPDLGHNQDIDFTRLLDNNPTVNIDFTDGDLTRDESGVVGLANFLYGHRQQKERTSKTSLNETAGTSNKYREYRSVVARRAVAQNTYNTLAAMKAAGSGASDAYIREVLKQVGLPDGDTYDYLGDQDTDYPAAATSYNAQMEVLTKKLYQDPAFYANLMDSKSNVRRSSAALQGIGLMQSRDIYKSAERSEMLLAVLVELEARKMVLQNQKPKGN